MSFEKFEVKQASGKKSSGPTAYVVKNGAIRLNKAAVSEFALDGHSHADIYYDATRRLVGIMPRVADGSRKISLHKRSASLGCKGLFDINKIVLPIKTTRAFVLEDMVCFSVDGDKEAA